MDWRICGVGMGCFALKSSSESYWNWIAWFILLRSQVPIAIGIGELDSKSFAVKQVPHERIRAVAGATLGLCGSWGCWFILL